MPIIIPIEKSKDTGEKPFDSLPALCTVQEFARYANLSDQTVRKLTKNNELPSMKIGRRIYVLTQELAKQIKEGIRENG